MDSMRPDCNPRRQPTCHQANAGVEDARKWHDPGSVRQEDNQVPSACLYKVLPHSDWLGRATQLKPIIHYFIPPHLGESKIQTFGGSLVGPIDRIKLFSNAFCGTALVADMQLYLTSPNIMAALLEHQHCRVGFWRGFDFLSAIKTVWLKCVGKSLTLGN